MPYRAIRVPALARRRSAGMTTELSKREYPPLGLHSGTELSAPEFESAPILAALPIGRALSLEPIAHQRARTGAGGASVACAASAQPCGNGLVPDHLAGGGADRHGALYRPRDPDADCARGADELRAGAAGPPF